MRIRFSGIPGPLIPAVRNYLVSQGLTASAIDDNGNIDPQTLIGLAYDKIEFKSRFLNYTYDLKNTDSSPLTKPIMQAIQPAVVISGSSGSQTLLAPYGIPDPNEVAAISVLGLAGLVFAGVYLYRHLK